MGQNHAPEPENSLPALIRALELGAEAVEFDVQLTADRALPESACLNPPGHPNEVVLLHDPELERVTDGQGCISETSADLLQGVRLKDGQGMVHPELGVIPYREALRTLRMLDQGNGPFLADVHIKVYDGLNGDRSGVYEPCTATRHRELAERVYEITREEGMLGRVLFTSYDTRVLDRILELQAERGICGAQVGLLTALDPMGAIEKACGKYQYVAAEFDVLAAREAVASGKQAFFEKARKLAGALLRAVAAEPSGEQSLARTAKACGVRILAWSPKTEADLRQARDAGADGWITDDVETAVRLRGSAHP